MNKYDELFEIVDESGKVLGVRPRRECHGNPALIHQAVHLLVFNRRGELFLQKRALNKDVQPGKWDSSVGGHMQPGETPLQAVLRETEEELGLRGTPVHFAYQYIWRNPRESELIRTYVAVSDGPFVLQSSEIDEGRFWSAAEITAHLGRDCFTPNFEFEFQKFQREGAALLRGLLAAR
jgi:isopentenyldiphosphate isomerase